MRLRAPRWEGRQGDYVGYTDVVGDSHDAVAESWAACEPAQLAVVLSPIPLWDELDFQCFHSCGPSDREAVGAPFLPAGRRLGVTTIRTAQRAGSRLRRGMPRLAIDRAPGIELRTTSGLRRGAVSSLLTL